MQDHEPFYGWLALYSHELDPYSPFHEVEHNLFEYDRSVYNYVAHPLWDSIESESLLLKILFADYNKGFAVIELFGVWNDLFTNDIRLLSENCLELLIQAGINKFILICENILQIYLESDDYYEALAEQVEDGWVCLLRTREHVLEELSSYGIDQYFFWTPALDELRWRKLKPWQLLEKVESSMNKMLT